MNLHTVRFAFVLALVSLGACNSNHQNQQNDGSLDSSGAEVRRDADQRTDADTEWNLPDGDVEHWILGEPGDERPVLPAEIDISGIGVFNFKPQNVETTRPDLFQPGFFSIFDVLNHLDWRGDIAMEYHFDPELDSHIIDDLNGSKAWWYEVFYDGGWPEPSVHRMDYYPVKDHMRIIVEPVDQTSLDHRESIWRTEVERRASNSGRIVIPEVTIRGPTGATRAFQNIDVAPHDLREDMLVAGTITAADIVMSLGDSGLISYGIAWYEHIGQAEINNYFVESIDDDVHSGACGFVYEVGESDFRSGNHIHVSPDMRILQSPEYALFYWIQLGPC